MSPEEMLKSNDIEIVQLGCNLLLNEMNIVNIEDLLKTTEFKVRTFDREYIVLEERWKDGLYEQMKRGNWYPIKKYTRREIEKITKGLYDT